MSGSQKKEVQNKYGLKKKVRSQPDKRPFLEEMSSELSIEWQENASTWGHEVGMKKA